MVFKALKFLSIPLLLVMYISSPLYGFEIETGYTTITYENAGALRKFNGKLYMSKLRYILGRKRSDTIEEEVGNKIDIIVKKVEEVLEMFPKKLKFSIVIHKTTSGVAKEFMRIYGQKVNYIAFYSPLENTVFFAANKCNLRVVAHEIGHVVAENYFAISPPTKIHEVLAQYAEMHITD